MNLRQLATCVPTGIVPVHLEACEGILLPEGVQGETASACEQPCSATAKNTSGVCTHVCPQHFHTTKYRSKICSGSHVEGGMKSMGVDIQ